MRLGKHKIIFDENTRFHKMYKQNSIEERHRHRYEVNPSYIKQISEKGLIFSGRSEDGIRMETLELPQHVCFIATQFHPEFQSRPEKPSPPYYEFILAAKNRSKK